MNARIIVSGMLSAAIVAGLGLASPQVQAQGDPATQALNFIQKNKQDFGLTGSDIGEVEVLSVIPAGDNGVAHVYLQQRYRGIEVAYGVFTVNLTADGAVLNPGHRFMDHIAAAAGSQSAKKSSVSAAEAAARHVGLQVKRPFEVVKVQGGPNEKVVLSDGGVAAAPVQARLAWFPTGEDAVRLSWMVEIEAADGQDHWYVYVDAESGAALGADSLVAQDSGEAIAAAIARPAEAGPSALTAAVDFPVTDGASYSVYPYPFESPTDGPQTLVTNAADPSASPLGWHDDGTTQYTVTRGNNVHAYTDIDANNVPDPGSDPDGGVSLVFNAVHDQGAPPQNSRPAAVTNLFYWNNIVHDVAYNHGFDEASGNFQTDNFGLGGAGNDYVRAEAQDGSGTNNANFGTPTDGNRPRMQMFVWNNPNTAALDISSPASIADSYAMAPAGFGAAITPGSSLNGLLTLVDDGGANPSQGCGALVGFPAGNIAVVDRGSCEFGVKGLNAQNAGAIGVVVVNNVAGNSTIAMGGGAVGGLVTIKAGMIGNDDGNLIKTELGGIVDGAIVGLSGDPDRDSDFDAGVIAHEYGHGISNRLTGGRLNVSCLGNAEQMGEGWSDWQGLVLTTSLADTATTVRGIGTYVIFEPEDGIGIRPTPYSTDTGVNPSTYAWVANPAISQPHGIGYVWNSMLWEVYWNLVHKHGYNANVYEDWDTGGNNLAIRLVQDGMKFQVCRPGFVDGRDAILAADVALTGGANQCEIWRGFVKRGLGVNALQGSSNNRNDGVENFDFPAACMAADFGGFQKPVNAAPAINVRDAGDVWPVKFTLSGDTSSMSIDTQPIDCDTLEPTGEAPIMVATPGSTDLKQKGDAFHLNWQTDAGWAGSCRNLTIRIPAESDAVAHFRFE